MKASFGVFPSRASNHGMKHTQARIPMSNLGSDISIRTALRTTSPKSFVVNLPFIGASGLLAPAVRYIGHNVRKRIHLQSTGIRDFNIEETFNLEEQFHFIQRVQPQI